MVKNETDDSNLAFRLRLSQFNKKRIQFYISYSAFITCSFVKPTVSIYFNNVMIIKFSLSKDKGLFFVPFGFKVIRWGFNSSLNIYSKNSIAS